MAAAERLSEIIIRAFDIDIQVEVYDFACFVSLLLTYEDFRAMPWKERVAEMKQIYGISVAESTLKRWCSKLIKQDMVVKFKSEKTYWCSIDKEHRYMVDGDEKLEADMAEYMAFRKAYVKQHIAEAIEKGEKDYKKINSDAWSNAFKAAWEKFGCCYYSCNSLMLNAIGEDAQEIFELVEEISEGAFTEYAVVNTTSIVPIAAQEQGFIF